MVFHSCHDGLAEDSNRTRKNPLFRERETIPFINKTPSYHSRLGCCDGLSRGLIFATGQRLESVFAGHYASCRRSHEGAQIDLDAFLNTLPRRRSAARAGPAAMVETTSL